MRFETLPDAVGHCDVFTGPSGRAVVFGLTTLAFLTYVGAYSLRRYVLVSPDGAPLEARSPLVFFLDLSKLGLGQFSAWGINLLNTHRNTALAESFDPLSWYFPTFLADELFAVPLGVVLGRVLCWAARWLRDRHDVQWCDMLARFGRYYPGQGRPQYSSGASGANGESLLGLRRERLSWWGAQLAAWIACVVVSRLLGGLVLPGFELAMGERSPFHELAEWIYLLPWECGSKRFVFAGFLRVLIDLVQIAVVDFFNKFVQLARRGHSRFNSEDATPDDLRVLYVEMRPRAMFL
eukprot:RCo019906